MAYKPSFRGRNNKSMRKVNKRKSRKVCKHKVINSIKILKLDYRCLETASDPSWSTERISKIKLKKKKEIK